MQARAYVHRVARKARAAASVLALTSGQARNQALHKCAESLRYSRFSLLRANREDLDHASGLPKVMLERLRLTDQRIELMAVALEQVAAQSDPVGATLVAYNRPDGLRIEKRRVPIGVIGIIYESRPNVTADAAGLCLKSANACILRGGREAIRSNLAIAQCLRAGAAAAGLPQAAITVIDRPEHSIVTAMARAEGLIDLIIPRGGERLIRAVVEAATIPVIKHFTGNCHVYVHAQADTEMARAIVINAKCQRPGVCNAAETLLVDQAIARRFLPPMAAALRKAGVELRGCPRTRRILPRIKKAAEHDWYAEYLDLVLAVKVVAGLHEAIEHINAYGSHHTDAIVTDSLEAADAFVSGVDSASVMVNASTRLADGAEYGLGAEVGISTDKLHARGPMGAEDLTTYKWIVTGRGHLRR